MHQIRYFLTLARTLNFTRAAEECNVTQPSLTRAIKLLEHELGGDLLRRERGLTHLTELGERMLPLLTQCHDNAVAARSVAAAMKARRVAALRIAMPHGVDAGPFAPHLAELLRVFDGLSLRILRGDGAATAEALREGAADLALATPEAMDWERLESWLLFREAIVLVAPPERRFGNGEAVRLADLAGERILLRRHCPTCAPIEAALGAEGVRVEGAVELVADGDLAALLASGAGIALAPRSAVPGHGLSRARIDGPALERELRLYAVRGRQRSAAASMLVVQLRAADWSAYAEPPAAEAARTA